MAENLFNVGDSLTSRAISSFPLSIGTALAFESLFDPRIERYDTERKIPTRVNLAEYQEIWINLNTLFRNIVGAVNKNVFINTEPAEFKDVINFEIDVINNLFKVEGGGHCKPVYYYCTYEKLANESRTKGFKLRNDTTDGQRMAKFKFMKAMELINKETDEHYRLDSSIKPKSKYNSLIMTHIPYDLLSYTNFSKLDLLESHTGKLKQRYLWNSKYAPVGENNLSNLPFIKKLLRVFGDKILIQPSDYKLRKLILDISVSRSWSPMTTESKINQDFSLDIKEPFVLEYLRHM